MEIILERSKATYPCTYKQVQYMRNFDSFSTSHNNTQLMKRLSSEQASEIIGLLKDGETIELN